jgi:acyl-CoA synthetase (AMP-forming)/AMP-acid ligase II
MSSLLGSIPSPGGGTPAAPETEEQNMRVPLNVWDYLERAAYVHGQRVAVVDEPNVVGSLGTITYAQLEARARGMALALDRMGVGDGERIAIVSPNAARILIAFFGVSGFNRIVVPANFRLTAEETRYIVDHSGATVLLVDPELDQALASVNAKHRIVMDGVHDAELFAEAPPGRMPRRREIDENETASINYTSGTTARPKGAQMTHRNIWINAAIFGWHTGVSEREVYLHTLAMFHCNGWGMVYAVTGMAGRHIVLRKVDGEEILKRIETEGVSLLCGAPAVVAAILGAAEKRRAAGRAVPGRGSVRMVVAGAPPPSKVVARMQDELGWEFIQIYGLTETSPLLTINRAGPELDGMANDEKARLLARTGPPALGVQIRVEEHGEVLARTNHVFEGYWEQPAETAKAIVDGWFHTGDGGHMDGPYLVISDRKKDVIITGGENVSSIEVEDCLFQNPCVAEAAVIGIPDEKWGETIKALVVLKPGTTATEKELIDFCRARMAHFKCPTSVEIRSELTRTATGKLQKFKLREPYWKGHERRVN